MKKIAMWGLPITVLVFGFASYQAAFAQKVFDLSADFPLQKNSIWQYGYTVSSSLDPNEFRADKETHSIGPIVFWHPTTNDGPEVPTK